MNTENPKKPIRVTALLWPEDWQELKRRSLIRGRTRASLLRDLVSEGLFCSENLSTLGGPPETVRKR